MRSTLILFMLGACAALFVSQPHARAADGTSGSNCAAITFRPVAPGLNDGDQEAGYYKTRLGRIELRAAVRNGTATRYFMSLNGNPVPTIRESVPAPIAACAKAKRLSPPVNAEQNCTGDRLVVLISHTAERRYLLLYAHRGSAWHFCSAGVI